MKNVTISEADLVIPDTSSGIDPPLKVPEPSPQVEITDPDFVKLTSAEKLNNSNYRKLVYQAYPDEPTCGCPGFNNESQLLPKPTGNFLVCRSGCEKCCSRMRQSGCVASFRPDNANKDDKVAPLIPTYCVGNKRDNICNVYNENEGGRKAAYNGYYCYGKNRLRGGGGEGGEERGEKGMYPQSGKVNGTMVRWFDDAWNGRNDCVGERRLGGGGACFDYAERHPVNRRRGSGMRVPCSSEENLNGGYPPYMRKHPQDSNLETSHGYGTTSAVAAGCCCPGRETFSGAGGYRENNGYRGKKSLPVVDCMVKAFRETQEFVDSLGRVPGLAGLGLMDPAESPYFGRARTKDADLGGPGSIPEPSTGLPNPQCTGPCNPQILRSTTDETGAMPFTIGVPGRVGVVREAVPSMPGSGLSYAPARSRKRDDKEPEPSSTVQPTDIDAGPCGEPRCRAKLRKKKVAEDSPPEDETAAKKIVTLANVNDKSASRTSHKIKSIGKTNPGRKSSEMIHRNGRKRSSVKVGRKMMNFVYSAGDTYSGSARGHKNCIEERNRIPGNMGWLWNLNETVGRLKPRLGWRPGAIGRHMSEILREAKANYPHESKSKAESSASSSARSKSAPSRGKRTKLRTDQTTVKKTQSKNKEDEDKEEIEPPPTLYIRRKDGTYYVTMYPIKQDTLEIPKLEVPMKPLQFKIAKNRDDASIASSSTASDMEIEFSPPAAVNRYRKKPNVIHVDTQVNQQEIIDAFKSDAGSAKDKKKGKKGKK